MKDRVKKIQGPHKPSKKTRASHKQNWARSKNVHNKAVANTPLGTKVRAMLYDMTKDVKYKEKNFKKNFKSGKIYKVSEVRSSLASAKRKATANARKQYVKVTKVQKKRGLKKSTLKKFKEANPHLWNPLFSFDEADIEAFYDS